MRSLAFDTPFIINHHFAINKTNGEDQRDFASNISYLNNVMNEITTPMIGNASTKTNTNEHNNDHVLLVDVLHLPTVLETIRLLPIPAPDKPIAIAAAIKPILIIPPKMFVYVNVRPQLYGTCKP